MRGDRIAEWLDGYRAVLRTRDLRLLFGALITSATGSWAYNVALLAFVFSRTHSLGWVGAAGLGRFIPALVFSTYGGVIAERTERIRLMVGADLLCAVWQAGLVVSAAARGPVVLAIALAGLTAATNIVYNPAVAFPSVTMLDDSGRPMPTIVRRTGGPGCGGPEQLITLRKGKSAFFIVSYADQTGYEYDFCPASARLRLTPPGSRHGVVLRGAQARIAPYGGTVHHLRCGIVNLGPVHLYNPGSY